MEPAEIVPYRCIFCKGTHGDSSGDGSEFWYRWQAEDHTAGIFCSILCEGLWKSLSMDNRLICVFGNVGLAYYLINMAHEVREHDPDSQRSAYSISTFEKLPDKQGCDL